MARTEISKAEAVKAFKKLPLVQSAKPGKIRYKDDAGADKERDGYIVKDEELSEKLILSAAKREDGTVVVVTVDGKKHEARA